MRTRTPLKPRKLKRGDLIGVVSPASPIADATRIEKGVRYLESVGYRVKVGRNVGKTLGYLAGTDTERAADLHEMFADSEVKAIVCTRGGYGTPRLLSLLNYRLIARHPKIFVGFSDVTALQLALWKKCRLITFHGPMAGVEMANGMDPFTEEIFWRCLTSEKKLTAVPLAERPEVLSHVGAAATGRLLGGNLSLVISLLGTSYQPDFTGALLFLEEVAEEPYRIDRMLTHLRNASVLSKTGGIIFGQFTDCVPSDPTKPSFTVEEILRDVARVVAKPVIAHVPVGHVPRKLTIPIGLRARIVARDASLEFLEGAVR
jgi:muramoyltetrapeptide carboxypeptidase